MPALQVRDFPDELYEKLKKSAQRGRRSISQQTITILQDYLDANENTVRTRAEKGARRDESPADAPLDEALYATERTDRRQRAFELIDQLPDLGVSHDFPDIVTLIHEGRETR